MLHFPMNRLRKKHLPEKDRQQIDLIDQHQVMKR